ncbi:MAG: sulfatase [Proteobacteria bacterium]|nr:sulfatase [Pseudomonadota bacterium]MCP4916255.1 sulfatase [Pseudomonadota bacterium]
MWLLAMLACESPGEPGQIALSRDPSLVVSVELPESSREGPSPESLSLGPWTRESEVDGVVTWTAPKPIGYVDYGHSSRRQPSGMEVTGPAPARYKRQRTEDKPAVNTWDLRGVVRLKLAAEAPAPTGWSLSYDRALQKDRRLHRNSAGLSDWDFVTTPIQPERDSLRGLLLPAPARITYRVTVPKDGRLVYDAELLRPVFQDGTSDGADVVVSVDGKEEHRTHLAPGDTSRLSVELADYSGQTVELAIATEPGEGALYDLVFLGDVVLFTPEQEPETVVLVFIDTLRADALGTYGGDPQVSPVLDAWAEDAVVFENARSPAPWTVPSTRTVLTGRQPDLWDPEISLPSQLAREGFRTEAFISNAFLDTPFGQGSSWGRYTYEYLASAEVQVDRAIDALGRRSSRDKLVMVHFMEPHVPYMEPEPYRSLWAGEQPPELAGGMGKDEVERIGTTRRDQVMPYIQARYKQNVRYLDAELERLFAALPEDAIVVVFSDHGEEFGDHGGFEHGHTLYDELLHVPLMVKAPGLEPTRVAEPVGLIDVMPTVLDLLEMDATGFDGTSLVPAARGDAGARQALTSRPIGVGYTLYKTDAWGLIDGSTKWILREGRERIFDLAADPGENNGRRPELEESEALSLRLGQALGREVGPAWRISGYGKNKHTPAKVGSLQVTHPSGIQATWGAYDPLANLQKPELVDGAAVVEAGGAPFPREWYVVPNGDVTDPSGLALTRAGIHGLESTYEGEPMVIEGRAQTVLTMGVGASRVSVMPVRTPAPVRSEMSGVAKEREDELRALGYLE